MKNYLLYFFVFATCLLVVPHAPQMFPVKQTGDAQLLHILDCRTGEVCAMPTEDYVLGVLQKAAYPYTGETLRAIAVAVRSRALYCEQNRPVHDEAAACDDPNCCTAFARSGFEDEIVRAVSETAGTVLLYRGQPAAAMMHPSSGAYTASAESIYGVSVPYLTEVKNIDEDCAVSHTWDKQTFLSLLGLSDQTVLDGMVLGYDRSHRIHTAELGTVCFDGKTFASLLSLPSQCIDLFVTDHTVHAVCYGEGEGVGMSMHGASLLEKNGADFCEILLFYFPDTQIGQADI